MNKTLRMFYTSNFLLFDRNEMYRKVFYTFNFLQRKISLASKMFYFIYPPVNSRIRVKVTTGSWKFTLWFATYHYGLVTTCCISIFVFAWNGFQIAALNIALLSNQKSQRKLSNKNKRNNSKTLLRKFDWFNRSAKL